MCNPMFLMAAATATKGIGDYSAAMNNAKAMKANAAELERAAADTAVRGGIETMRVKQQGEALQGQQKAAMAANGLDFSSGTGADISAKASADTQFDAMTVQSNAMREAYGLNVQAIQQRYQAKAAKRQAQIGLAGSLLGSGSQAWGGFKGGGGGSPAASPKSSFIDGGASRANQYKGYA